MAESTGQATHEDGGPPGYVLDVDLESDSGSDSALGASLTSDTSSLRSSLFEGIEENGRTYHKYKAGNYYLPNDESEQERLDLQHHLFTLTFDGQLQLAPIVKPQMVLDMGTGTGIWAMEYATQNPHAVVIGSDLSAIQPDFAPPNCRFVVDDAEDEWQYSQPFDYIHGRAMFSCFKDPLAVFKKAFDALAPGGYFEMQEIYFKPHSIDGTVEGTALEKWMLKCARGAHLLGGKDWHCAPLYASYFSQAGFTSITERQFSWPSNSWPKGAKQKELGLMTLTNSLEGIQGVSMAIFSRAYGMSAEEIRAELVEVERDFKDRNIHAYYPIYVVYGRKPHPDDDVET